MADPLGRFSVAFNDPTLTWAPTWTVLDSTPNLVTSYQIDRGRQFELDRTDTGRAIVEIADKDGLLDPSNSSGPYYGLIEPLLQAIIRRKDPVAGTWHTRYRGFIEELDYVFDPSQRVNKLVVSLVDLFEILNAVEMTPGDFGDPVTADTDPGNILFDHEPMDDRVNRVLDACLLPAQFRVVFTGNVEVRTVVYTAAESAMTAVLEAVEAEFPGVGNVYVDRQGRLCVHGRLAKFDPAGTAASSSGQWEYANWKVGDGAAVAASPADTAQMRSFAFNRGLAKIINRGLAYPMGIANADIAGQQVNDPTSVSKYGVRSWSAENLITQHGLLDDTDANTETKRFADYYVQNYKQPRNRVTDISFRTIRTSRAGGPHTWGMLSHIDIADTVEVTVASPGGGGFNAEPFFVEGIHETVRPLNPLYDDVTMTLDLSPRAYFTYNPFPTS